MGLAKRGECKHRKVSIGLKRYNLLFYKNEESLKKIQCRRNIGICEQWVYCGLIDQTLILGCQVVKKAGI